MLIASRESNALTLLGDGWPEAQNQQLGGVPSLHPPSSSFPAASEGLQIPGNKLPRSTSLKITCPRSLTSTIWFSTTNPKKTGQTKGSWLNGVFISHNIVIVIGIIIFPGYSATGTIKRELYFSSLFHMSSEYILVRTTLKTKPP